MEGCISAMLYKVKFFLRCIILNGFKNKLRTVLSIIGIFIGVFFFAYTNIIIDSFYNAKMQEIENMPKNVGIIYQYGKFSESDFNLLNSIVDIKPSFGTCTTESYVIRKKQLENDIYLNVRTNIVGVGDYEYSTVTVENEELHIVTNNLVCGRYISAQDNVLGNKVIVIDEVAAKILFPDKDPIGEKISFSKSAGAITSESNNSDIEYEIVGVIESNYYKKYNEEKLANTITKEKETEVFYETTVYVPESVVKSWFSETSISYALWNYNSKEEYYVDRNTIKMESDLASLSAGAGVFVDEIVEKNDIKTEIQNYRTIIVTITVIMLVLSGLNNMNIFFFSIKERIREIGIRKTFGATKTDIIFQFVSEGIFVGFIASILAILASVLLGIVTTGFVWNIWEIKLVFEISISSVILPLLIGLLQSIVFAIIPSFYGAKILITESLRFD